MSVCKVPNPNKRSCSVWLIHLKEGQFEYQLKKMKVVALLSVIVNMGQRFAETLIQIQVNSRATFIFQIMQIHLDQVIVVWVENFRVLKGNQAICS